MIKRWSRHRGDWPVRAEPTTFFGLTCTEQGSSRPNVSRPVALKLERVSGGGGGGGGGGVWVVISITCFPFFMVSTAVSASTWSRPNRAQLAREGGREPIPCASRSCRSAKVRCVQALAEQQPAPMRREVVVEEESRRPVGKANCPHPDDLLVCAFHVKVQALLVALYPGDRYESRGRLEPTLSHLITEAHELLHPKHHARLTDRASSSWTSSDQSFSPQVI